MAWTDKERVRFADRMAEARARKQVKKSWVARVFHHYDILGVSKDSCMRREGGNLGKLADLILDVGKIGDVVAIVIEIYPDDTFKYAHKADDTVVLNAVYPKRKR